MSLDVIQLKIQLFLKISQFYHNFALHYTYDKRIFLNLEVIQLGSKKVLIVDDDERIRDMIKEYISLEEYEADETCNGIEALELISKQNYSIVILDIMMPKMDGWTTCSEIRKISKVPVIMLSARGEEYDKLFGFELGVDDYIVKPFSPKELLARMGAVIRRCSPANDESTNKFIFEGLVIEFESRNVYVDDTLINLTPKEYELLQHFVKNPRRVYSREQLLNSVWGYEFCGDDRTVDTHVKMLRESLKTYRKYIVTVWGTGYKFETGGRI
ncbi:MAG: winged helix family two component transcriptional regulator [Bacillales bacterium]|jgi:DNA-binding response OmpR family regulator|nr:winged helix family two component transcriptional regulator [Bacillales bacterium]